MWCHLVANGNECVPELATAPFVNNVNIDRRSVEEQLSAITLTRKNATKEEEGEEEEEGKEGR